MDKGDTSAVLCPCCEKILFKIVPIEQPNGKVIEYGVNTNPKIETDNKGPFMKCPHCLRRIAMIRAIDAPVESYDLDENQQCI